MVALCVLGFIVPDTPPISFFVPFNRINYFLAGHGILSKFIYAHPPAGVPLEQAKIGGMIMYYGGDVVDIVMIFNLCLHWFRATRAREFWGQTTARIKV